MPQSAFHFFRLRSGPFIDRSPRLLISAALYCFNADNGLRKIVLRIQQGSWTPVSLAHANYGLQIRRPLGPSSSLSAIEIVCNILCWISSLVDAGAIGRTVQVAAADRFVPALADHGCDPRRLQIP